MKEKMLEKNARPFHTKCSMLILLAFMLSTSLLFTPSTSHGATPPTITLDMYEQIEMDMTKEQVEDIIGGPGDVISTGKIFFFRGAEKDHDAVRGVTITFDENGVRQKEIRYAFKKNTHTGKYEYTGEATRLNVPSHVHEKRNRTTDEKTEPIERLSLLKESLTSLSVEKSVELKVLDCSYNKLTMIDISQNKLLEELNCSGNKLSKLNVLQNKLLENLCCASNKLTTLNVSKCVELKELDCSGNKLPKLNVSKCVELKELRCEDNKLTKLNVSKCVELKELGCAYNKLTKLNVTKNKKLKWLWCAHNKLTKLNVSQNKLLIRLGCYKNKIKSLNVSKNTKLDWLEVSKRIKKANLPKQLKKVKPFRWYGHWLYIR